MHRKKKNWGKSDKMTDLFQAAEFSAPAPVKKDLMKTAGSNIIIVCLETGQVIPPSGTVCTVVFIVLQGEGIITSGYRSILSNPIILFR